MLKFLKKAFWVPYENSTASLLGREEMMFCGQ